MLAIRPRPVSGCRIAIFLLSAFAFCLPAKVTAQVVNDFTGDYAPGNWSVFTEGGATIDFTGSTVLTLKTPDDGSDGSYAVNAAILTTGAGTIQFDYSASTTDPRGWGDGDTIPYDYVGYAYEGDFHQLSPFSGNSPLSGTITLPVASGADFEFIVGGVSVDTFPATMTITHFSFTPSSVPEPEHYAVVGGAGLAGFAIWRRWARRAAAI